MGAQIWVQRAEKAPADQRDQLGAELPPSDHHRLSVAVESGAKHLRFQCPRDICAREGFVYIRACIPGGRRKRIGSEIKCIHRSVDEADSDEARERETAIH